MTHRTMRVWLTSTLAVLLVMAGGSAAWAFWTASGTKTGTVSADAFPTAAGAKPTVSVAGGTATVKFTAVTTNGGRPAGGYTITRYDGTGAAVQTSTTCNTAVTPVSCSMSSVPLGAWTYSYKPLLGTNWGGTTSLKSDSAGATKLAFTTAARSGTASATANLGPITVEIEDAAGQAITVPSDLTVSLSSNSAGTATFGASSGGSALTSVTISANSSSASFFYGDTKAASPTITASATSVTSTTQIETINAGTATTMAFTATAASGTASTSPTIGPFTVEQRDSFGNPATSASARTLNLSSNSTGTARFAATSGGGTVTSVVIAAGSTSASFYYGDTKAATPTITVASTGFTSIIRSLTINPGTATQICITQNPNCSGGAAITATRGQAFTMTAYIADALNNKITVTSSTNLSVSLVPGGDGSVSPASVSIPANQTDSGTFAWAAPSGSNKSATVSVTFGSLSGTINLKT